MKKIVKTFCACEGTFQQSWSRNTSVLFLGKSLFYMKYIGKIGDECPLTKAK